METDFTGYLKDFFGRINLSTGEYWSDHEIAAATSVTEIVIAQWREWTQNYLALNPKAKFSDLLAARWLVNPDDRSLALGEYWKVTPFGRVRVKEETQVDSAGVSLDTISKQLVSISGALADLKIAIAHGNS